MTRMVFSVDPVIPRSNVLPPRHDAVRELSQRNTVGDNGQLVRASQPVNNGHTVVMGSIVDGAIKWRTP